MINKYSVFLKTLNENYNKQINKSKVDDDFVEWLSKEFYLLPETVWSVAEISNFDPLETYNILNQKVDDEGYGFDQPTEKEEDLDVYYYTLKLESSFLKEVFAKKDYNYYKAVNTFKSMVEKTCKERNIINEYDISLMEKNDTYYLVFLEEIEKPKPNKAVKDIKFIIENLVKSYKIKFTKWNKYINGNVFVFHYLHDEDGGKEKEVKKLIFNS